MQMFMSMYAGKSVCEWLRMGIRMGIGALSARWWGSERSRSLSCSPPWNMQMIIWCIIHWRNVLQASSRSSPLSFNWLRWDCVKKKKGMIGPIRLLAAYFSIPHPFIFFLLKPIAELSPSCQPKPPTGFSQRQELIKARPPLPTRTTQGGRELTRPVQYSSR